MKICPKHPELNGEQQKRMCAGCKRAHERLKYAPIKAANKQKRATKADDKRAEKELKESLRPTKAELVVRHREARKRARKKYYAKYKDKKAVRRRARKARQRAAEKQATVVLSPEQKKKVSALYSEARRLTRETGIQWVVHHVKALSTGGLHHPDNLEVVSADINNTIGTQELSGLEFILS